jgi:hypothetical protein
LEVTYLRQHFNVQDEPNEIFQDKLSVLDNLKNVTESKKKKKNKNLKILTNFGLEGPEWSQSLVCSPRF